jgi:hypothetical protein
VEDGLIGRDHFGALDKQLTRAQIAGNMRMSTAGNLQADTMTGLELVSSGSERQFDAQ